LAGQEFIAMDSGRENLFTFTPAISIVVNCAKERELDHV
jgi:predicted 3-demethylubiquinone-9 3-methyltransferase (glyoxalase superfamily)